MAVLVTGGMGYIGSHTTVELLKEGYEVVIVDNLSNSKELVKDRIKAITGKEPKFYKYDVLNKEDMDKVFSENTIDSVIHFAGFKAVGESVAKPLEYYHNNLTSTFVLLELMRKYGVKNFVFSSSATVYGDAKIIPITEEAPLSATNPYGRTKLMLEEILRDLYSSDNSWNIALLRYFNPVGAHESGTIGEDPCGIPNNLMPFITKVAIGELKELSVFGDDYDTPDGTGVRDYIHVVDLAKGHLKALEKLKTNSGLVTYNLGTGNGYSVLDIVKAFSEASGREIPYKITARRPGDIATCYSEPRKANEELGWTAEKGIKEMCEDSWRWQSQNPKGYEE
ncbi:UDP-glucose 4-epimerase GalE [Clostridium sulfidigenes]|uniref:UDP-glucose 4-epimerase GalE n=1 Tax=Clostridium sulfidigenes TaxID=318464 RepID=UPI003F8BB253